MIDGVEPLFQRIANGMASELPDGWASAELLARFFPGSSEYLAEYVRPDGVARGFLTASDADRAVRELRRLFQQAGRPLWGEVCFTLKPDGSFHTRWGYDGCDRDGNLIYDEAAEVRRHEERQRRLTAG